MKDGDWKQNLYVHINKIHTAFHQLLYDVSKIIGINLVEKKPDANKLYKSIFKHAQESDQKLLENDSKLIATLSDLRNNNSCSHPNNEKNKFSNCAKSLFLKDIKTSAEKLIKYFFKDTSS